MSAVLFRSGQCFCAYENEQIWVVSLFADPSAIAFELGLPVAPNGVRKDDFSPVRIGSNDCVTPAVTGFPQWVYPGIVGTCKET
ncbi:MAG: hypothetical protein ACLGHV_09925 [Gammaproteobacteria bacterium]